MRHATLTLTTILLMTPLLGCYCDGRGNTTCQKTEERNSQTEQLPSTTQLHPANKSTTHSHGADTRHHHCQSLGTETNDYYYRQVTLKPDSHNTIMIIHARITCTSSVMILNQRCM